MIIFFSSLNNLKYNNFDYQKECLLALKTWLPVAGDRFIFIDNSINSIADIKVKELADILWKLEDFSCVTCQIFWSRQYNFDTNIGSLEMFKFFIKLVKLNKIATISGYYIISFARRFLSQNFIYENIEINNNIDYIFLSNDNSELCDSLFVFSAEVLDEIFELYTKYETKISDYHGLLTLIFNNTKKNYLVRKNVGIYYNDLQLDQLIVL